MLDSQTTQEISPLQNSVHIYGPAFSTFVRSVMLCCEEKSVPYTVGRELDEMQQQALIEHPFGKIPLLLHGQHCLFETAPICRYLDAEFPGPNLQPVNHLERAMVDQWTQVLTCYVDETIVRKYLLEFAFPKGEQGTIRDAIVEENTPGLLKAMSVLEHQLGEQAYLCGDQFSIADALLIPMLDYLVGLPTVAQVFASAPKCKAYIHNMRRRESCQRVLLGIGTNSR